jgi:hypothetical protein
MIRDKLLSVKEKNKIADRMRSSRKYLDESDTKLFQMNPIQQPEIKQEENVNNPAAPVDEPSTYERQEKRSTSYYYRIKKMSLKNKKNIKKN